MNPLIRLTFPDRMPTIDLIIERLKEKTGLSIQSDFYQNEGIRRHYSKGELIYENNSVISKYRFFFEGVEDYELDLYMDSNSLVIRKKGRHIGYFEGCILFILIDLGASVSPLGLSLPDYVALNFREASSVAGFIL